MNESLIKKMQILRDSRFIDDKFHRYTNSVSLNGYLCSTPVYQTLDNGNEIATFYLLQLHKGKYNYYPCQVFSKTIIEQLKSITKISFVNILGRLVYSKNARYSCQVEEISISHEFVNLTIEPPYVRESK